MDYKTLVKELPAPQTKEEQYIYALVCSVAEVENTKKLSNSPFYRLEQYWSAFYHVMSNRLGDLLSTTPKANEVSNSALQKGSVSMDKLDNTLESRLLGNKRITEDMLVDALADKLLSSGRITEDMLAKAVADKLLGSNRITEDMLTKAVADRLIREGGVTYDDLSSSLKKKIDNKMDKII